MSKVKEKLSAWDRVAHILDVEEMKTKIREYHYPEESE